MHNIESFGVEMASKNGRSRGKKSDKPASAQSRSDSGLPESDESSEDNNPKPKARSKPRKKSPKKGGIDLTDPEDLLQKLDQLQLTEEETEELLKHAYSINRKLKQEIMGEGGRARRESNGERLPPIKSGGTKRQSAGPQKRTHNTRGTSSGKSRHRPEWVD